MALLSRRKTRSRPSSKKTIQCFLDPAVKDIARGNLAAKSFWEKLTDQLQRQESYTKIYSLTLIYTTKLEEGSFDVDGYPKSIVDVWRRLKHVNLSESTQISWVLSSRASAEKNASSFYQRDVKKGLYQDTAILI